MDLTDEALVDKFRQTKDKTLFASLVRRYQNRIYNAAYRMLGNKEEAEEVVQETFINLLHNLDKFRHQSTLRAWIFRIAHNLSIDRLRAKKRRIAFTIFSFNPLSTSTKIAREEDEEKGAMPQIADSGPDPQALIDLKEQSKIVQDTLNKLPESQRAVLVLHDIEGLTYQDIADIVDASVGTVRSRLHYGRLKLKELLTPYFSSDSCTLKLR